MQTQSSKAESPLSPQQAKGLAMRVSLVSVAVNLVLSAGKLLAGVFAHSGAMISDAVHSASDVFSTLIVMIGIQISSKQADAQHRYGHERFECVASVALALILLETGLLIGWKGLKTILAGSYADLAVPGMLALVAAAVSIVVKEWMYWYTRAAAKKIHSDALMADAWHHRSDSLSSIGALVGIVCSLAGFPVMDSVASVVICIFIVKAAVDIFRDAVDKMSQALEQVQTADCRPMPLEEAFAVYEEYRAVMMEFINTVPDYLTTISPKVRHLILKAAWFMDKKYYTAQMRELLDALKARPKEDFTGKKFLVTGIMLDAEPVLELLEELGVAVVDDLLCHESMQFRTPTRAGGTVESKLAYRFLDLKGASPLYEPRKPRGDLLAQLARERGADGVLFCLMKFCDPEAFDHPLVKKDLAAQGIPLLSIEHDQLVESTEQLRTRIQGFLEINLS